MNTNSSWKGYTLQELRINRIITETRIEIAKAKLLNDSHTLRSKSKPSSFAPPLFKKFLGALDYADYMVLAFSIGRKEVKLLGRKKR